MRRYLAVMLRGYWSEIHSCLEQYSLSLIAITAVDIWNIVQKVSLSMVQKLMECERQIQYASALCPGKYIFLVSTHQQNDHRFVVDNMIGMDYNMGVDGSMTVHRHVEAPGRFSFG